MVKEHECNDQTFSKIDITIELTELRSTISAIYRTASGDRDLSVYGYIIHKRDRGRTLHTWSTLNFIDVQ